MHLCMTTRTNTGRNPSRSPRLRPGATAACASAFTPRLPATSPASLESAHKLGCNALQIFSASPRMWPRAGSRIAEADAARFRARRAELGLGPLVIHANYLINLASSDPVMRARSIQAFHDEMVRALALGADFLVVHPGSARRRERRRRRFAAVAQATAAGGARHSLQRAVSRLQRGGLRVLLENTSGMGSAIGVAIRGVARDSRSGAGFAAGRLPGYGARIRGRLRDSHRGGAGADAGRRSIAPWAWSAWLWCT